MDNSSKNWRNECCVQCICYIPHALWMRWWEVHAFWIRRGRVGSSFSWIFNLSVAGLITYSISLSYSLSIFSFNLRITHANLELKNHVIKSTTKCLGLKCLWTTSTLFLLPSSLPTPSYIIPWSAAATLTEMEQQSLLCRPIICHFILQSQRGTSCCQGFPALKWKVK